MEFGKVAGTERNGIILYYLVTYEAVPGKGHANKTGLRTRNVPEDPSQNLFEVYLYDLEGAVAYAINVSAFTMKGEGPVNSTEAWTIESGMYVFLCVCVCVLNSHSPKNTYVFYLYIKQQVLECIP